MIIRAKLILVLRGVRPVDKDLAFVHLIEVAEFEVQFFEGPLQWHLFRSLCQFHFLHDLLCLQFHLFLQATRVFRAVRLRSDAYAYWWDRFVILRWWRLFPPLPSFLFFGIWTRVSLIRSTRCAETLFKSSTFPTHSRWVGKIFGWCPVARRMRHFEPFWMRTGWYGVGGFGPGVLKFTKPQLIFWAQSRRSHRFDLNLNFLAVMVTLNFRFEWLDTDARFRVVVEFDYIDWSCWALVRPSLVVAIRSFPPFFAVHIQIQIEPNIYIQ